MRKLILLVGVSILLVSRSLFAADLESLAKEGYKVVDETSVVGEFKKCIAGMLDGTKAT